MFNEEIHKQITLFALDVPTSDEQVLKKQGFVSLHDLLNPSNLDAIRKLNINQTRLKKCIDDYFQVEATVKQAISLFGKPRAKPEQIPRITEQTYVLSRLLRTPALIQIYGQKGCGKTSALLECIQTYHQSNPNRSVLVLNAGSGITKARYLRLKRSYPNDNSLIIRDVWDSEGLVDVIKQSIQAGVNPAKPLGLIAVDEFVKPAKYCQHPQRFATDSFILLLKQANLKFGVTSVFTNHIDLDIVKSSEHVKNGDKVYVNPVSHFGNAFSPFIDARIYIKRATGPQQKHGQVDAFITKSQHAFIQKDSRDLSFSIWNGSTAKNQLRSNSQK